MTARSFEQQTSRRLQAKHSVSSRAVSILLALGAEVGLAFLVFERSWVSSTQEDVPFWVRQFIVFALYSAIQCGLWLTRRAEETRSLRQSMRLLRQARQL